MHFPRRIIPSFSSVLAVASLALAGEITQVAPGVYFREGDLKRGQANGGYIVAGDGVVAIEAPSPAASAEMLDEARKLSDKPIRFLILTHGHWDHDGGAKAFLEKGVTLICHERLRVKHLKENKAAKVIGVRDRYVLKAGERTVEVIAPGTCHSPTDILVRLPAEGVVFTGDTVVSIPTMWMGECDLQNWIEVLGRLKAKIVCPGHGRAGGPEVLDLTRSYLLSLRDQVACQVCQGRDFETTLAQLAKPHREDYGRDYLVGVSLRERFAGDDKAFADHVKAAYSQLVGASGPLAPSATSEPLVATTPSDGKPHALALIGDRYHPPDYVRPALESALASAAVPTQFVYDVTKLTPERLKRFKLLIVVRDGMNWPDPSAKQPQWWLTDEQEKAIVEFIRAGGGLLALHSANALRHWENRDAPYAKLLGSVYNHHGAVDERFPVRVLKTDHPVTRGVADYLAVDERHRPAMLANDITLLLEAGSGDQKSVLGYVRQEGKGRICYLASGHNRDVLGLPATQRLLANAARWCCGLSIDDFIKKPTFQYLTREGLEHLRDAIVTLAEAEGLPVHAQTIRERFKSL